MAQSVFPAPSAGPETYTIYAPKTGTATVSIPAGTYTYEQFGNYANSTIELGPDVSVNGINGTVKLSSTATTATAYAPDALTFTSRTSGFGASHVSTVVFGNNLFMAAGQPWYYVWTSTDGVTWGQAGNHGLGTVTCQMTGYGNGLYLVGANSNATVSTSTDTVTWTTRTSNLTGTPFSHTYGNGLHIVGGASGTISTSTDGVTWTARTSNLSNTITALAYGKNTYVAADGSTGGVSTSTDGTTWTTRTTGFTAGIVRMAYGGGIFMALANSGGVTRMSTDGITWAATGTDSGQANANGIAYFGGVWTVSGTGTTVRVSYDFGKTWTQKSTVANVQSNGVAGGLGRFVVIGQSGNLSSSTNSIPLSLNTLVKLTKYTTSEVA